ncbi:hypothetical protein GJ744_010179 [Endocarpon pusillum]|uniref:Uncharacterized protein n=1 Tax=Endocarpon pusillum TaxID=364733 RepID=A0A8H7AER3_9EURO|nr:hypothetical protein GJ744_010179 [Endocarpon pusillum]
MATVRRHSNSLLSATNENNVALATFNFDFTLLKVEAPTEFSGLASALSSYRRNDAEEGLPHKTARRLGALFQDIIPPTPKLIAAYGTRVSEVVKTPGINPSGSKSHGPFESFVGADGTTLWAAATSGVAAIGVYLLSCLLARAWDAKQSTSLWVELIAARKREVEQAFQDSHLISSSTLFSARQDISRNDLARWDSSARSWLRSADQAKSWEHHQLALILKNINLPFTSGSSTYASVMDVWREAMVGMEALLCGRPLSASTGSLFLAFSAWHLFPNLIVLGNETVEIKFRDKLFPSCAIVTVGKQAVTSDEKGGFQWSLALSHFHYYGGPIVAQSNREYSRVTFPELRLISLGGLLGAWRIGARDQIPVAEWFLHLSKLLQQIRLGPPKTGVRQHFGWLEIFVRAAEDLCVSNGPAKEKNLQLIKYGSRRVRYFLTDDPYKMSPFFGLGSPPVLAGLSQELDMDCGIEFLRAIARDLGFTDRDSIVCYTLDKHIDRRKVENFEYATAIPHTVPCRKRNAEGVFTLRQMHTTWTYKSSNSTMIEKDDTGLMLVQKEGVGRQVSGAVHWDGTWDSFLWREVPRLYRDHTCTCFQKSECISTSGSTDDPPSVCRCFETVSAAEPESRRFAFKLVTGSCRLGLFLLESKWRSVFESSSYCKNASGEELMPVIPSVGLGNFSESQIKPHKLWDYMCLIIRGPQVNDDAASPGALPGITFISDYHKLSMSLLSVSARFGSCFKCLLQPRQRYHISKAHLEASMRITMVTKAPCRHGKTSRHASKH